MLPLTVTEAPPGTLTASHLVDAANTAYRMSHDLHVKRARTARHCP